VTEHGYDGKIPIHIIDANEVVQMGVRRKKSKMLLHLTCRIKKNAAEQVGG
jgi:hypothetical protein